jgi:predicted PhzF superfamily epimerase YddE/YHI9
MSGTYEFVQLDVFTKTPLTGNPLVVFIDARGVTSLRQDYGLASGASLAFAYLN